MSNIVDISVFPYTVPASTWFVISGIGILDTNGVWNLSVTNVSNVVVIEVGWGLFNAPAPPGTQLYTMAKTSFFYHIVLQPGDVISVAGIIGMRLLQINEPSIGRFLI